MRSYVELNVDEMIEVLNIFKSDMSPVEYDQARGVVLKWGDCAQFQQNFTAARRSHSQRGVLEFFLRLAK